MIVYSKTLQTFRKRLKTTALSILHRECNIPVKRTRFLFQGYYYPIEILLFEKKGILGQFDSKFYTIGMHRNLLYLNDSQQDTILNILRHEIAHYLCYLQYGDQAASHGKEYRQLCKQFNWQENVYSAKLESNFDLINSNVEQNEQVLAKIKKLLALSASKNEHEARAATYKANQLIQKYHFHQQADIQTEQSHQMQDDLVSCIVWEGTRNNSKLLGISELLSYYFVFPYFNYGKNTVRLEVLGEKEHILIADYLTKFYSAEYDRLWKMQNKLKGLKAKNSFFRGLTKGHVQTLNSANKNSIYSKEIVKTKNELEQKIKIYCPRFAHKYSKYESNTQAELIGLQTSNQLKVRKPIEDGIRTGARKLLAHFTK